MSNDPWTDAYNYTALIEGRLKADMLRTTVRHLRRDHKYGVRRLALEFHMTDSQIKSLLGEG